MKSSIAILVVVLIYLAGGAARGQHTAHHHPADGMWEHVPGLTDVVDAIAVDGSDIYVGGLFTDADGNPNGDGIVKWNGSSWEALGQGLDFSGPADAWIHTIAVDGDDVYVGGLFTDAGGNPDADYFAKWNGSAWDTVGTRLNANVFAIAIQDTNIYVGGFFLHAGGNANANHIARWNGHRWEALGEGLNHYVWTIAIHNGDIYAGGRFTDAGGDTSADYIARWNSADSTWEAVGNGLGNTALGRDVSHIGFLGDELYIGGRFENAGGDTTANLIARLNGNSWEGLGPGLSPHPWITSGDPGIVAEFAWKGNDLYVAGFFGGVGSDDSTYNNVAKWNGSSWERLGCGVDPVGTANTLAVAGNDVYFGGGWQYDCQGGPPGQYMPWLAKWLETPTGITGDSDPLTGDFRLRQNYPNPFNPTTNVEFGLRNSEWVTLKIYDLLGREVKTLVNERLTAGNYTVQWDGRNDAGQAVSSGVYLYRIDAGEFSRVRKMVLMQ